MALIKTPEEIEIMSEGGKRLSQILRELVEFSRIGVTTIEIDELAEKLILKNGGKPSFKTVSGYKYAICTTVNEDVVHGLPGKYRLADGDIVGIDVGMIYKGFHTDTSITIPVGEVERKTLIFLETGKSALVNAVQAAKEGNRVWDISKAMEDVLRGAGFSPVKSLTGHGIGKKLHEEPQIPCYAFGSRDKSPVLRTGMTLAIEAIYNMGGAEIVYKNDDNWTISTADGSLSAVVEETIVVTRSSPKILTPHS